MNIFKMKKQTSLLRMLHIRDKAILKGRRQQKKLDDVIIEQIRKTCEEEKEDQRKLIIKAWDVKVKQLEKQIIKLQEEHKKEIAYIREQERNKYEPRLEEAKREISRLNEEDNKRRNHYNSILQYGIMMERTGEKAIDKFNRAGIKLNDFMSYLKTAENIFGEVVKLIDSGQTDVEYAQTVMEKEKPKLLKGLE